MHSENCTNSTDVWPTTTSGSVVDPVNPQLTVPQYDLDWCSTQCQCPSTPPHHGVEYWKIWLKYNGLLDLWCSYLGLHLHGPCTSLKLILTCGGQTSSVRCVVLPTVSAPMCHTLSRPRITRPDWPDMNHLRMWFWLNWSVFWWTVCSLYISTWQGIYVGSLLESYTICLSYVSCERAI